MILNGAESGKHTGMILIDLQKAFDILFKEFFFVSMDTVFSEARTINCGVP